MHLVLSQIARGEGGWSCRKDPRLTILSLVLLSLDRTENASRLKEELQRVVATAGVVEASRMLLLMNVRSLGTALTLSATKRCTEPLPLACSLADRSF